MEPPIASSTRVSTRASGPPSSIKPFLRRVSGSKDVLDGLVAERVMEGADAAHLHDPAGPAQHVVVIPTAGSSRLDWKTEGRQRSAQFQAGDIIINPKGNFVAPRWSAPTEFLLIGVDGEFWRDRCERMEAPAADPVPEFSFRDDLLWNLASALTGEFEQERPPDLLYAESLAQALIAHLAKRRGGAAGRLPAQGMANAKLRRVCEHIEERLEERIHLSDLAKLAGLSESHFLTAFRRAKGVPPHRYLMIRRIENAMRLLRSDRLSIAEIAQRCGFADQSHLTRTMRKITGRTPAELRGK